MCICTLTRTTVLVGIGWVEFPQLSDGIGRRVVSRFTTSQLDRARLDRHPRKQRALAWYSGHTPPHSPLHYTHVTIRYCTFLGIIETINTCTCIYIYNVRM